MPSVPASDGQQQRAPSVRAPRCAGRRQCGEIGEGPARELVDRDGLGGGERAHRVDEPPARAHRGGCRAQHGALRARPVSSTSLGRDAPARVGAAPQHAETAARRVEQHAVERSRRARPWHACRRRRRARPSRRPRRSVPRASTRIRAGVARRRRRRGRRRRMRSAIALALPPGAAARSSTRSPGCGSSAATTAWLAWSCGVPRPSRTAASAPTSPAWRSTSASRHERAARRRRRPPSRSSRSTSATVARNGFDAQGDRRRLRRRAPASRSRRRRRTRRRAVRTIQSGCDVRTPMAAIVAPGGPRPRWPGPRQRPQHAVDVAALRVGTTSTVSPTAACGGDADEAAGTRRGGARRAPPARASGSPASSTFASWKSSARCMRTVPYTSSVTSPRSRGCERDCGRAAPARGCARTRRPRCVPARRARARRAASAHGSLRRRTARARRLELGDRRQIDRCRATTTPTACAGLPLGLDLAQAAGVPSAVPSPAVVENAGRAAGEPWSRDRAEHLEPVPTRAQPRAGLRVAGLHDASELVRPGACGSRRNSSASSFSAYVGSPVCGARFRRRRRAAGARAAGRCRARRAGRAAVPAVSSGSIGVRRTAYTGPVSSPASMLHQARRRSRRRRRGSRARPARRRASAAAARSAR